MIDFFNINKGGGSGGDGSSLNIFTQLEEPAIKKGIWLKKEAEPEYYTFDEDVFLGGEWASDGTYANIPYGFTSASAVAVGTDIYLLGSDYMYNYTYPYKKYNYKYNTLTDTYTRLTDIPYGFENGAAVVIGTDIYLLRSQNNYKYDTLTDTYTQMADIPFVFGYSSAVAVGTDIYLLSQTNNYKYDTLTDTYTQLTNIPYNFYNGSAVALGTDIYLLGGSNASPNNQNYKYDTLTDTYTQLTNIPYRFYTGSAVAIGTEIYLLGGSYSDDIKKYNYKYDILTDTYTKLIDIPYDFYRGSAVVVNSNIYLFGSDDTNYSQKVQAYILATKTFEQDNLIVVSPGSIYNTELCSNTKNVIPPKYGFDDAWYYTISGGLETDIPTYYGDGTQWINIKNPPSNNVEEEEI